MKLLRSRTTKITYYSDQAKFYLMENSPDPDFVGQFYHGKEEVGNPLLSIFCQAFLSRSLTLPQTSMSILNNLLLAVGWLCGGKVLCVPRQLVLRHVFFLTRIDWNGGTLPSA